MTACPDCEYMLPDAATRVTSIPAPEAPAPRLTSAAGAGTDDLDTLISLAAWDHQRETEYQRALAAYDEERCRAQAIHDLRRAVEDLIPPNIRRALALTYRHGHIPSFHTPGYAGAAALIRDHGRVYYLVSDHGDRYCLIRRDDWRVTTLAGPYLDGRLARALLLHLASDRADRAIEREAEGDSMRTSNPTR